MLGALMGGPQGGPPPQINLPSKEPAESSGEGGAADKAIAGLEAWYKSEQDPQDKAVLASLVQKARQLKAQEAKEADSAMGLGAAHKFIRRQQAKKQSATVPPQGMGY